MESGEIKEDQIMVSSKSDKNHDRNEARLNSKHGWVTSASGQPFITVRLFLKYDLVTR